ncbi:MAG: DUF2219 domain-containing protein [Pseudomonas fluorescens]|nr:MAG: DUF2219 domain-containing protein [Pseudomonas fluorescens]
MLRLLKCCADGTGEHLLFRKPCKIDDGTRCGGLGYGVQSWVSSGKKIVKENIMMKNVLNTRVLALGMAVMAGNAMASDVVVESKNPILGTVTKDADQFVTLTSENDKFFGNSDRHYTNGAQINYTKIHDKPEGWVNWVGEKLPFLDIEGPVATSYSIGQQIFTPDHAERPFAQPGDQPFSGFLYGKVGFTNFKPEHTDTYELTLGMVGPSAQGEYVQKTYHEAFDYYKPLGWDYYQLNDEPIVNLSFLRRHPGVAAYEGTTFGQDWFVDATPHYGFAVGNAYDYANVGGVVRFGPASARNMDVPGMTVPGQGGTAYFAKTPNWFDWYLFAGVDGRLVARNIFLDGNTWQNSPHVDKEILVGNLTTGLAIVTGDFKTSLTVNQETKTFKTQGANDVYGAINVSYRF